MRKAIETRRGGFTLIELLVVIGILGILVSLILVASADGVRRAEERATQSLITKLETALNDRYDALLNTQPPITQTHRYLAAINYHDGSGNYVPVGYQKNANGIYAMVGSAPGSNDDRRAQVIAQFDYMKAEIPDVFFLNSQTQDGATIAGSYPLNFAAAPYPAGTNQAVNFVLPLGNSTPGLPLDPLAGGLFITQPQLPTTGMFGASFSAAGGIYKNLGYGPLGYDGIDNDNNGLIDDYPEGIKGLTPAAVAQISTNLANHQHKTARSEMLYAILVEGLSPLGSSFSREDFTSREVQDTDGDGLPEFVDAWGEPLQFFRWPIYYGGVGTSTQPNPVILGTSDSQLGSGEYANASATRQQDQLDTNQLLVSPGWWTAASNFHMTFSQFNFTPPNGADSSSFPPSPGAIGFMNYFHSLVEPFTGLTGGTGWDRGSNFNRREYFTKFLVLSGGPDREPGVAQFAKDYSALVDATLPTSPYLFTFPNNGSGWTMEKNALALNYIENQASVSDPTVRTGPYFQTPDTGASAVTTYLNQSANSDDITNHNISGISTGVR
jgi:prepilin-type N-terminal cleavage/methylation domain-containing protein